ncbi:MAG: hypothetical protein COB08_016235 [Rhodobacteraceae bacterium]|nr:hypothetical protein [Paracoccaceae bacterium]
MKALIALIATLTASVSLASDVEIVNVQAAQSGGIWQFDVTLRHADSGWEHYADGWEVLALNGTSLGMRVLAHPHVNEQPFTRSLGGIVIPDGTTEVIIRARDNVDGWTVETYTFNLP